MEVLDIPIYRAKRICEISLKVLEEYIEGDLVTNIFREAPNGEQEYYNAIIEHGTSEVDFNKEYGLQDYDFSPTLIDISTLEISFDNENWYSIDEARRRINASYLSEAIVEITS